MKASQVWRGVRLRTVEIGADPDAPLHRVAVPAEWDEEAACGLVGLACDAAPRWDPVRLPDLVDRWVGRLESSGAGGEQAFATAMHELVALRRACPDAGLWRGALTAAPAFVVNLAAFVSEGEGLDEAGLESATRWCALALSALAAGSRVIRVADVDGLLARLGLDYDSEAGRQTAARVVRCVRQATDRGVRLETGPAGPAEALLGVETAGFAPAFSLLGAGGGLTRAARARLAAMGLSAERALAMALGGQPPLRLADSVAYGAMHDALAPLLDSAPPPHVVASPTALRRQEAPTRRPLPARSKGFMQKVTIGGQRLFLRTGEYADGSLGEVSITLAGRDGALAKGLAEAVGTAVSVALQHGVPLSTFIETFAHGRFGASGPVDGDPAILSASSPLDYVVRALSDAYLGRPVSDPPVEEGAPMLPLGLTGDGGAGRMRQRALRLVSPA